MKECRRFIVAGRVQGVWFRESTRQQAEMHGLAGHAVNLPDGTVEVIACGPTEAILALKDWLHVGPPLAQVIAVHEWTHEGDCPPGFRTGHKD